jgi:hypothetical protein
VRDEDNTFIEFVGLTVDFPTVDQNQLTKVRFCFSDQEIVKILQLVCCCWGLGRLCTILDIDVEISDNLDAINAISHLPRSTV